jgi:putative ABC transport system permease protein
MVVLEQARDLLNDVRVAGRRYVQDPFGTATALLMLTVGLGGGVAVFAAFDAVFLRPLPYKDPARLVRLFETNQTNGDGRFGVSPGNLMDWRRRSKAFDGMALFRDTERLLSSISEPELVRGALASPDLLRVLGIRPARGPGFSADEAELANEVIISDSLWRRAFSADPAIAGHALTFDRGKPLTIVGVMPPEFRFPDSAEFWLPTEIFGATIGVRQRGERYRQAVARLRPGTSLRAAQTEMTVLAAQLAQEYPAVNAGWNVSIVPLDEVMNEGSRTGLWLAAGAIGCCLLLVWVNLSVLLFVKGTLRRRDWAIRSVLGATGWQLGRQVLAEGLLLASVAGAAAVVAAQWLLAGLIAVMPTSTSRLASASIDLRVFGVAVALVLVTTLVVSLAPAIGAARVAPSWSVGRWGGEGSGRRRVFHHILVAAQVGVALTLVVVAGLLIRSYAEASSTDLGFDGRHALGARIRVSVAALQDRRPWYQLAEMQTGLLSRLATLPGVQAVAATTELPLERDPVTAYVTAVESEAASNSPVSSEGRVAAARHAVSTGYFRTLGIGLVRGRVFSDTDVFTREALSVPNWAQEGAVAIVSESLARRLWPGADPLGQLLRLDFDLSRAPRFVVGVVRDVRYGGVDVPHLPEVYLPNAQAPAADYSVVVRTDADVASASTWLRREVRSFHAAYSIQSITSISGVVGRSLRRARFLAMLLTVLSALSLSVAASGVYCMVATLVSRRTGEFGLRLAIGARPRHIFSLASSEGVGPASLGVVFGLGLVWMLRLGVSALLYNVRPSDPATIGCAVVVVLGAAVIAAVLPARRAARLDPWRVLRSD